MMRHFSLFSGIESFKKALDNLKIDNELVGYSEFDKYASVALAAIHGVDEELNYGDITKIDETKVPDCDLITYGFPCQDISVAGLGRGIVAGETRSGLLYEALRIIRHKKPKYAIAENVKNLVGKKFKEDFEGLLSELESYGYNNYWKVLNSKDYGIPQNRERVFVVSIRKDIDNGQFTFPNPFDNGLRLKDLLEDEVEDKYYIDNDRTSILLNNLKEQDLLNGERFGADSTINDTKKREISNCIIARYDAGIVNQKQSGLVVVEPIIVASRGRNPSNPSDRTVGSTTEQRLEPNSQGLCNTLTTVQKDNLVLEPNELKFVGGIGEKDWVGDGKEYSRNYPQGNRVYDVSGIACSQTAQGGGIGSVTGLYLEEKTANELQLFTNLKGGKWDKIHESARRVYDEEGIAPTIPTCGGGNIEPKVAVREATKKGYAIATVGDSINLEQPNSKTRRGRVGKEVANTLNTGCNQGTLENDYRIRKLTPLECWRLMGFSDEDYHKARQALEDRFYNGRDRSNSQMYKMAGNSIVVNVLEKILYNLLIEDYKQHDIQLEHREYVYYVE